MKKNSNFNQHMIHFYDKPDQLDEKKKHARKKEDIFNRRKKKRQKKEALFLITNKPTQELTSTTNNVIRRIHHHKNSRINKGLCSKQLSSSTRQPHLQISKAPTELCNKAQI